jgi:Holliday junction resolvase
MNTKDKGNRVQRKLIEMFEQNGYTVSKAGQQRGRFTTEKDMFGLFDLVAIKDRTAAFIQVTCNKPHTHKNYVAFAQKHAHENLLILQWVWIDRKHWEVYEYFADGTKDKEIY